MPPEVQAILEEFSTYQAIIWVAFGVGLILGAYKAWPVIRRFVVTVDALGDLPDFMERIRHQVENDHDTNLRDELTQILDQSNALTARVAELADWQTNHELRSDAAVARIENLEKRTR